MLSSKPHGVAEDVVALACCAIACHVLYCAARRGCAALASAGGCCCACCCGFCCCGAAFAAARADEGFATAATRAPRAVRCARLAASCVGLLVCGWVGAGGGGCVRAGTARDSNSARGATREEGDDARCIINPLLRPLRGALARLWGLCSIPRSPGRGQHGEWACLRLSRRRGFGKRSLDDLRNSC